MEFAILLEFLADMLRDAPYPAFSEDVYVKTMVFKYGSRKLSGLVGYQMNRGKELPPQHIHVAETTLFFCYQYI